MKTTETQSDKSSNSSKSNSKVVEESESKPQTQLIASQTETKPNKNPKTIMKKSSNEMAESEQQQIEDDLFESVCDKFHIKQSTSPVLPDQDIQKEEEDQVQDVKQHNSDRDKIESEIRECEDEDNVQNQNQDQNGNETNQINIENESNQNSSNYQASCIATDAGVQKDNNNSNGNDRHNDKDQQQRYNYKQEENNVVQKYQAQIINQNGNNKEEQQNNKMNDYQKYQQKQDKQELGQKQENVHLNYNEKKENIVEDVEEVEEERQEKEKEEEEIKNENDRQKQKEQENTIEREEKIEEKYEEIQQKQIDVQNTPELDLEDQNKKQSINSQKNVIQQQQQSSPSSPVFQKEQPKSENEVKNKQLQQDENVSETQIQKSSQPAQSSKEIKRKSSQNYEELKENEKADQAVGKDDEVESEQSQKEAVQNNKQKAGQNNKEKIEQQQSAFYISTQAANMYPDLDLKPRISQKDKGNKSPEAPYPTKIKILQYHSQYFLKIETQVFEVQVYTQNEDGVQENYKIDRRFSDFLFLYESIITDHLGYIIPPFPEKSIDNFIKLKMSFGSDEEKKYEIIQKRLYLLQNFVNFLISHKDLKHCEQLAIFLFEDTQLYAKGKQRIEKYIAEYVQLQNPSNIKKVLESGISMVRSWIQNQQKQIKSKQLEKKTAQYFELQKINLQFQERFEQVHLQLEKYLRLLELINKLIEIQKKFEGFNDIDTDIDQLLKLCSKLSSGRQYCSQLVRSLQNETQPKIQLYYNWLKQTKTQLIKRNQILHLIVQADNAGQNIKRAKLQRRLARFNKNFLSGYTELIGNSKKIFTETETQFKQSWQKHCLLMKAIWKVNKK